MARIIGQHIRAQHQHAHHASGLDCKRGQVVHPFDDLALGARVIEPDLGIIAGAHSFDLVAQHAPFAIGVTADEETHHVRHILWRAGKPVLHRQEVGTQVLRLARDEFEDLWQAAQHRHLARARAAGL